MGELRSRILIASIGPVESGPGPSGYCFTVSSVLRVERRTLMLPETIVVENGDETTITSIHAKLSEALVKYGEVYVEGNI